jgi:HKD family nuclease
MIIQDAAHPNRVLEALAALLNEPAVERVRAAVSYANADGVRTLQRLVETLDESVAVEVVVTLDMGITRKAALEMLLRDFHGSVSVVETSPGAGTFHTKTWVVDRDAGSQRSLTGSANLTGAALTKNREAVSVGDLDATESDAWEAWWNDVLREAEVLTEKIIAGYEERQPPPGRRQRIADVDLETDADGVTIPTDSVEAVDARDAEWLAIDWGGTGAYRVQFEIPKAAAAFFDPEREHRRNLTLRHAGTEFHGNQLRFYPDNGMVRINMDGTIPVVADGSIRSGMWLFTRLGTDHFELQPLNPAQRTARLAAAALTGDARRTSNREYGWT